MLNFYFTFSASGDPTKMALVDVESKLPPLQRLEKMSQNLTALLPYLSVRNTCNFFLLGNVHLPFSTSHSLVNRYVRTRHGIILYFERKN